MVWNYQNISVILEDFLNRSDQSRLVYKNKITIAKPSIYEYKKIVQMGLGEMVKAKICQEILGVLKKEGIPEEELDPAELKIVESEYDIL